MPSRVHRSSPSAAVAFRWRATARCSTSTRCPCSRAPRPRVCFLPTASGDADHYVVRFYRRFSPGCEASHVSLFRRDQGTGGVEEDLATHLLSQDLIYVGGGNVLSMLGAWRAHGLDAILRGAWRPGIVLCGPSAGSLCWFDAGAQRLPRRAPAGTGARPAALFQLRALRRRARSGARVPPLRRRRDAPGFAVEDGVALHFLRHRSRAAVSSRPGRAPRSSRGRGRACARRPLEVAFLGAGATPRAGPQRAQPHLAAPARSRRTRSPHE